MAFKAHTTFNACPIPEVMAVIDETYEDANGNEVIRKVKKNVNSIVPVQVAVDNQLINQINAGQSIRRVSTLIDTNDRFDAESALQNVPRETPATTEN